MHDIHFSFRYIHEIPDDAKENFKQIVTKLENVRYSLKLMKCFHVNQFALIMTDM